MVVTHICNYLGHPGARTLTATIRRFLKTGNLDQLCLDIRKQCSSCQRYLIGKSNYALLQGTLQNTELFQDVVTDILGPFPTNAFPGKHAHAKFWILTIIDRCARWSTLYILYNIQLNTVFNHFNEWINIYMDLQKLY